MHLKAKDMGITGKSKIRKTLRRWLQPPLRNQRGALLLETVVTLSVFGILGIAVLATVQTSYIGKRQFDEQSTAENLIRNQIEYVFEQDYKAPSSGDYVSVTGIPTGFTVTAEPVTYDGSDPNIEIVRVTVYHEGQSVKVFEIIRADR